MSWFHFSPNISLHIMTYSLLVPCCAVLGHEFIDILKVDVETAEFDALTSFLNAHTHGDLPIGQMQLEIHAVHDYGNFEFFRKWWEALETAGLRPFNLEPNLIHVTNPGCRKPEVVEVRLSFFDRVSVRKYSFLNRALTRGSLLFAIVFIYQHPW